MYNKDLKSFRIRRNVPVEGWPLRKSLKERYEKYISEFLKETAYVEVPIVTEQKREVTFSVTFNNKQPDPDGMEKVLESIANMICSEVKAEGEALNTENLKKLIEIRAGKLRKE